MKKVAVVLSGCGKMDGSEIHEAVLTLLALDKAGVTYQCFAPDILQRRVVNHATGETVDEQRNVLVESARIARCEIENINKANPNDFVAVVFPGGFGAALNLSDFGVNGAQCRVEPETLKFAKAMAKAGKALGFICIAPTLIPRIFDEPVDMTIGTDAETAQAVEKMGAHHVACSVTECVIDKKHKVVSTPAYMLGQRISEVATGIEKAVQAVLSLT